MCMFFSAVENNVCCQNYPVDSDLFKHIAPSVYIGVRI